jgi:hypothetical protein
MFEHSAGLPRTKERNSMAQQDAKKSTTIVELKAVGLTVGAERDPPRWAEELLQEQKLLREELAARALRQDDPEVPSSQSTAATPIDATMKFLKTTYAPMKAAGEGYREGDRKHSKPILAKVLLKQLKKFAADNPGINLKVWTSPRHLEAKMNEYEIW